MKERPILFSAPMVRALLDGTKTQTRRLLKMPQGLWETSPSGELVPIPAGCRYGAPGDRLWVREAWQYSDWSEDGEPWIGYAACGEPILCRTFDEEWNTRLGDIWAALSNPENYDIDNRAADRRWRPSIHMPRWASRITLEVTGVRVERLNAISEADAIAEGADCWVCGGPIDGTSENDCACFHTKAAARDSYRALWEQINGAGSWAANPWVWVIEFRRIEAA